MDHRLIKFLAVVEHNGFTNAAQATHITQPALTVAIRQLEKEYGTKLLYRSSGRFELTPTGQVVYDSACRMRNEQRAMRHQLATHEPHASTLRLGLLDSVAALLLTKDEANEQLKEVWIDNSARLLKGLQLGRIDAAIITSARHKRLLCFV